ncbi:MAG: hypothetical protein ACOCUD_02875 [Bacillota bacterium]
MKYIYLPFLRLIAFIIAVIMVFLGILLATPVSLLFGVNAALNWWVVPLEWFFDKIDNLK